MFEKSNVKVKTERTAEYIPLIFNNGKFAQPIDRSLILHRISMEAEW